MTLSSSLGILVAVAAVLLSFFLRRRGGLLFGQVFGATQI